MANSNKPVGLTQSAGYQAGVRRTFPLPLEEAWHLIISPEGISLWLGSTALTELRVGEQYTTGEGISGEIRVVNHAENIRMTWKPENWDKPSTLQIRTIASGSNKTTISFHQENLPDAAVREEMIARWGQVLADLKSAIG
ncbi:SRPBCC family protein [Paenibacillus kobensis]|uniref:SRPBCC family protein n=1 Tax=Paenibacillus kobensis TaxID=59841 RepID=UPI000FDCDAE2|nr:SRPBCC domain-containing protein [Paenibacillus kobensis]